MSGPLWDNNLIQFARLLDEIRATQDNIDWGTLCESMDLNLADIDDLFDRAMDVWERAKANLPMTTPNVRTGPSTSDSTGSRKES